MGNTFSHFFNELNHRAALEVWKLTFSVLKQISISRIRDSSSDTPEKKFGNDCILLKCTLQFMRYAIFNVAVCIMA